MENIVEDWSFKRVMFVDEVVESGVRHKFEESQRIRGYKSKAVSTSIAKKIELSRNVVETKRKNAKLVECISHLMKDLENVWPVRRLKRFNLEKTAALVQTLETQLKDVHAKHAKHAKVIDKKAQSK